MNEATDAVRTILKCLGEDPDRDGLRDTPGRVIRALTEMTAGYSESAEALLSRVFDQTYDEMVILRDISFYSLCEHHVLPFYGVAHIGYLPSGKKVVGLSKLARLVYCFSRRLQIQERLTYQIANAIQLYLKPAGVGVVIEAKHLCMSCRGVSDPNATMVTSSMLGALRDKPEARDEFLRLIGK